MTRRSIALAGLAVALAAAGCTSKAPTVSPPTTPAASSPSPPPTRTTMSVTVYYLVEFGGRMWLAPERHLVKAAPEPASAAIVELADGVPQDPDHFTPIPRAAMVNALAVQDGTATVDWNTQVLEANVGAEGESLGIQSIVWTLTRFPGIERVAFTVEGKTEGEASNGRRIEDWWGHVGLSKQPFTRADRIDVLEPITVWSPTEGARIDGNAIVVSGEASTFEANVGLRVKDASGKIVVQTSATAAKGGPGRGAFTKTITFTPPDSPETWTLEAVEESAEDGSDFFVESRRVRVG